MINTNFQPIPPKEIVSYIQFTKIDPDVTKAEIINHIELCKKYNFDAAMIAPCWVSITKDILQGTNVKTASFIDFGMGNLSISGKVTLIENLRNQGVDEVDFAPNMGFFLSGMYELFLKEAQEIVAAAEGMPIKAMLQIGMIINIDEKKKAIRLLEEAGVDWIKNSSGGWPPGATSATVEDIRFIKATLTGKSRVKASGGIKTYDIAIALIEAGAELLGTSNALEIIGAPESNSSISHDLNHTY